MTKIFFLLSYICGGFIEVTSCPTSHENWEKKAEQFDCPTDKPYECLGIKGMSDKFFEACLPVVSYPKGTYPMMDLTGNRDAVVCPSDRFQNVTYVTNQPGLYKCPNIKTTCKGLGQSTMYTNSYSDNYCLCEPGYEFQHYSASDNASNIGCKPSLNNCTCIKYQTQNITRDENKTNANNSVTHGSENEDTHIFIITTVVICCTVLIIGMCALVIIIRKVKSRNKYRICTPTNGDYNNRSEEHLIKHPETV